MHLEVRLFVKFIFFWHIFHWKILQPGLRKDTLVKSRSNLFGSYFHIKPFGMALLRPGCRSFQWNMCQKNMNLTKSLTSKCIGSWKLRSVWLIEWHLAVIWEIYCDVTHNLGRKTRWQENCLDIVTRIPLTMWTECEEFVSLNEDAYWLFRQKPLSCRTS